MNQRIRLRVIVLGMLMVCVFIVLIIRTFWIQVVNYNFYMESNLRTWARSEVLQAKRGTIYDRNHKPLALEASAYNLVLFPKEIAELKQEDKVASGLHNLIGKPRSELEDLIKRTKQQQVEVHTQGWNMDYTQLDRFKEHFGEYNDFGEWLHFPDYGVGLLKATKRYYPYNELAAHVVGYINKEGEAISGTEAKYDALLQGQDGKVEFLKDNRGNPIPSGKETIRYPTDGESVTLTIDIEIQRFLNDAMKQVMAEWRPHKAMGVVMDPNTMEVLAMTSMPDFNPNSYWKIPDIGALTNHTIHFGYEPGSTFKLVTLAAAIEEGVFRAEDHFKSGHITVSGSRSPIHDVKTEGWGYISYQEGLEKSSNVAFIKLGLEQLGADKLKDYITRFGFAKQTGIELGSESKPIIAFERPSEIATATFGQGGIIVNSLQLATSYAAIANGGTWKQPSIIHTPASSPRGERRIVSAATAKEVTERLEKVILNGTGKPAYIDGYRVAGKTGTAQIPEGRGYSKTTWLISFVGYAPADNPKAVVAIVVDQPQMNGDYTLGGRVAMPAFRDTMLRTMQYMGVKPEKNVADTSRTADSAGGAGNQSGPKPQATTGNYIAQEVKAAVASIKQESLDAVVLGNGSKVLEQYPSEGTKLFTEEAVYLVTDKRERIKLPSLSGLPLRDALAICQLLEWKVDIEGEGYVVKQEEQNQDGNRRVKLFLASGHSIYKQRNADQDAAETADVKE
ncbi:penicillin-binding protein 2B [Paenibacillus profundus]|uniref:Penicillin-binding protein 2B n=1 Tax=Paenibacillus profundus TaxID=1173085 RepID=A0ABS8YEZ1_9BACL|nr:penicillin-binding transpeptidase domain-containing protein [Paenibacillus profundus]MCE5168906.1 penicillin-binding protein 2B [Paenibacillus profundus]